MDSQHSAPPQCICMVCRRGADEWFIRMTVEDAAGLRQQAFICANCGIRLRVTSENNRGLQIDPWVHEAIAIVLRGKESVEPVTRRTKEKDKRESKS